MPAVDDAITGRDDPQRPGRGGRGGEHRRRARRRTARSSRRAPTPAPRCSTPRADSSPSPTATSLMHGASLRCSLPSLIEDHPARHDATRRRVRHERPVPGRHPRQRHRRLPTDLRGRPAPLVRRHAHPRGRRRRVGGGRVWPSVANDTFAEGLLLPPVRLLQRRLRATPTCCASSPATAACPTRWWATCRRWWPAPTPSPAGWRSSSTATAPTSSPPSSTTTLAYAERRTRGDRSLLPDGTYHGEFTIDTDGISDRVRSWCGSRSRSTATARRRRLRRHAAPVGRRHQRRRSRRRRRGCSSPSAASSTRRSR